MTTTDRPRIIFLDIDGVLASGRSWILPENAEIVKELRGGEIKHQRRQELALATRFDPCAVALINRLCEVAGARVVIHSNWRRNIGVPETHAKLIEQGIPAHHFHEKPVCPMRMSSEKNHDIGEWLDDNRLTKRPKRPKSMSTYPPKTDKRTKEAENNYWTSVFDFGIDFIVIDDENLRFNGNGFYQVQTDFAEGFTVENYRTCCAMLGGHDTRMGVHKVAPEDLDRATAAFWGDKLSAVEWLHKKEGGMLSRASRLDIAYHEEQGTKMALFGRTDPKERAAKFRQDVLDEMSDLEQEQARKKAEQEAEHAAWLSDWEAKSAARAAEEKSDPGQ